MSVEMAGQPARVGRKGFGYLFRRSLSASTGAASVGHFYRYRDARQHRASAALRVTPFLYLTAFSGANFEASALSMDLENTGFGEVTLALFLKLAA